MSEEKIEDSIRSMDGVSDVIALHNSGVTCLVEVSDGGSASWLPRISTIVENSGLRLREIQFYAAGTLDRADNGEIDRSAAELRAVAPDNNCARLRASKD
ncbi:hypothetical protein [Streptomyces sp. NPDC059349]|uniref:hypothetical protein n=1 Tax=Streptomyces sp. NPDC059349 TaxID=3346808 RepID=UPI003681C6A1